MYKIIAVDDEALALKRFEHIIKKENRVNLLQTFTDSTLVVDYVKNNTVDIAFLDIEMPKINGLELAELIQEADPYINIIFVTAFDQYALEAFKAHAIGYLLKPLDAEEFEKKISTLEKNITPRAEKKSDPAPLARLRVNCLGQFTCFTNDGNEAPISFRTAKTAELFALLIHHYDAPIAKFSILDSLFPDSDYEKSNKLFYVSCSYLRSAFAKANITDVLLRENDNYRVNTQIIDCDYIKFMEYCSRMKELSIDELKVASMCYKGEYLSGKTYEWAFDSKPYIETLFKRLQFTLVDALNSADRRDEAYEALERFMVNDPLNEEPVAKYMTMCIEDGKKDVATNIYRKFEAKLEEQLDTLPSSELRAIIR